MKYVLTSIQPPHTTNIFDEIKSIEWRTRPMPTGKHYVYETKNGGGVGKVIGECSIWRVKRYENVSLIPEGHIDAGCVPYEFLDEYSKGKPLYAHFIVNTKRYDKPRPVTDFVVRECLWHNIRKNGCVDASKEQCLDCRLKRPPQSWCYVEELTDNA